MERRDATIHCADGKRAFLRRLEFEDLKSEETALSSKMGRTGEQTPAELRRVRFLHALLLTDASLWEDIVPEDAQAPQVGMGALYERQFLLLLGAHAARVGGNVSGRACGGRDWHGVARERAVLPSRGREPRRLALRAACVL